MCKDESVINQASVIENAHNYSVEVFYGNYKKGFVNSVEWKYLYSGLMAIISIDLLHSYVQVDDIVKCIVVTYK